MIVFGRANAQSYTYSYTDPCNGNTKYLSVPINGAVAVSYYGQVQNFTYNEITSGALETWASSIYSQFGGNNPCASIVGLPTAINITQGTVYNTIGILGTLSMIADVASVAGSTNILGGATATIGGSGGNSEGDGNGNNGQKSNNSPSNSNTNSSTQGSTNPSTTPNGGGSTTGSNNTNTNNQQSNGNNSNGSVPGNNGGNGSNGSGTNGNGSSSSSSSSSQTSGTSGTSGTTSGTGNTGSTTGTGTQGTNGSTSGSGSGGQGSTNTGNETNNQGTTTPPTEEKGSTNITAGGTNTVKADGQGGSSDESNKGSKSPGNSKEGGKPQIIASSDFVGFNFRNSEVTQGLKATGGYTALRWDGQRASGVLADYTSAQKGPNVTGYYAFIKPKATTLISLTATLGFEGIGSQYGTLAIGQMRSFKSKKFPAINKLKVVYMATASVGYVYKEPFLGTATIAGGMYDFKIGRRLDIKLMNLLVYSPYVSYYNDIVLKSPFVMLPSVGTNIGITRRFKFNINVGGAWAIKAEAMNYTVTMGTRLML